MFKPENWSGAQEKAYEAVVNEILAVKLKVCSVTKYACVPKEEKTIVVSVCVCAAISCIIWIICGILLAAAVVFWLSAMQGGLNYEAYYKGYYI